MSTRYLFAFAPILLSIFVTIESAQACTQPSSLDITQTAYLFNFIANSTSDTKGTEQELADFEYAVITDGNVGHPFNDWVAPGLLKTIGCELVGQDWGVVWGPGVYEIDKKSKKADNTAYVVYSPSQDTYILAIAGTNPNSAVDWSKEDLQVGPTKLVNWPYDAVLAPRRTVKKPLKNQISLGTANGIYFVLNMKTQASKSPNQQKTLAQFISQLKSNSPKTKFIVTGHSLGGALSPTIANWAKNALANKGSDWNGEIYAMPTAGASAGNQSYSRAWDIAFPKTSIEANSGNTVKSLNTPIFNQWDLVPHAWNKIYSTNAQADDGFFFWNWNYNKAITPNPPIYQASTQIGNVQWAVSVASKSILAAADWANSSGRLADMGQSQHRQQISGSWPINVINNDVVCSYAGPGSSPITSVNGFMDALGLVHVWGYYSAFGLSVDTLLAIKAKNPSKPGTC